tara:strand:- start:114 stop:248 length:135 start_codon:yes stop_codon:yes gene_type:complete
MHNALINVLNQSDNGEENLILVDGNDFMPLFRNEKGRFYTIPYA